MLAYACVPCVRCSSLFSRADTMMHRRTSARHVPRPILFSRADAKMHRRVTRLHCVSTHVRFTHPQCPAAQTLRRIDARPLCLSKHVR